MHLSTSWTPTVIVKENFLMERPFHVIFWPRFGYQRKCFNLTYFSRNILTNKMWSSVKDLHTVSEFFLYNYVWNKHFLHSNSYYNFCFTRAAAWNPNLAIKENVLMERQFDVIFWPDFGYQRKCFNFTYLSRNVLTNKMWISVKDL